MNESINLIASSNADQKSVPMGEQAARLLKQMSSNKLNVAALIKSPTIKKKKPLGGQNFGPNGAYEGYSNSRRE